jgi:hypothetical protein
MKRVHSLERGPPNLEARTARATELFPSCDPYYICMVVATRKQERGEKPSSSLDHTAAAQQRTNIFVARNPFQLVDRLNQGLPITDAHGLDLSATIAHLLPAPVAPPLPPEEQVPATPEAAATPPPPPPLLPPPLIIPKPQWPKLLDVPRELWIHRGTLVIGMPETMPLVRSVEQQEFQLDQMFQHLESLCEQQEEHRRRPSLPLALPVQRVPAIAPLQELAVARKMDTERKRRRRQKAAAAAVTAEEAASIEEPPAKQPALEQQHASQHLGMILGPLWTLEAARMIGVIWGLKSRGSIPRSALGEVLAERHALNLYANLAVVFEGEVNFKHHVLRQTDAGELWLVERTKVAALERILV